MGVLCLSVWLSWLIRGGVAPMAAPISSPSLGSVKWKEISAEGSNSNSSRVSEIQLSITWKETKETN